MVEILILLYGSCLFGRSDDVYHVTVMPCYDKKLEAAREDFVFQLDSANKTLEAEAHRITEVDSVLTSGEVLELIQVHLCLVLFVCVCVRVFLFGSMPASFVLLPQIFIYLFIFVCLSMLADERGGF